MLSKWKLDRAILQSQPAVQENYIVLFKMTLKFRPKIAERWQAPFLAKMTYWYRWNRLEKAHLAITLKVKARSYCLCFIVMIQGDTDNEAY